MTQSRGGVVNLKVLGNLMKIIMQRTLKKFVILCFEIDGTIRQIIEDTGLSYHEKVYTK